MNRDNPDRGTVIADRQPAARPASTARAACVALVLLSAAAVQARDSYRYVSSGAPLRAGVYGRVDVHGAPPPLISPRPVVARKSLGPVQGEPLYFYLPAGQVRKWSVYCERYAACERPVYFVRMENAPGKLGRWKSREGHFRQRPDDTLSAQADPRS